MRQSYIKVRDEQLLLIRVLCRISRRQNRPQLFFGEISSVLKVSNVLGLYAALELAMNCSDLQNKIAAIFRKFVSAL